MAAGFRREQTDEMVDRYTRGESCGSIGRAMGLQTASVARALARLGIRERQQSKYAISDGLEQEVLARYETGESMNALAIAYGVSPTTIRDLLVRHGNKRRPRGGRYRVITGQQREQIITRYQAGQSQHAVARALGISQTSVGRTLSAAGVAVRHRPATRERHGNWQGGRVAMSNGYLGILLPTDSPYRVMSDRARYVLEHRLVMAEALGRPLNPWETVHHINGDRGDNRLENLQLRIGCHGKGVVYHCADCGSRNIVPTPFTED